MAEVLANGVRFHVKRITPHRHANARPAQPVVFIHGLGMDNMSSFYYTLANPLAHTGADVILYDLRGHGLSERPRSGYRVQDSVDDLTSLLDALAIDGPVHLVGNSYGGTVAIGLAASDAERVASMVLIEAHFTVAGWAEKMEATLRRIGADLAAENKQQWMEKYGRKHSRMAELANDLINGTTFITDLLTVNPIDPCRLQRLTFPVRAIYGACSDVVDYGHQFKEFVPSCELTLLSGFDHSILIDAPVQLREIVLDWFATQASVTT